MCHISKNMGVTGTRHFVRTDEISWITGVSKAASNWLKWTHSLQKYLNENLLLGLFSFESQFAH